MTIWIACVTTDPADHIEWLFDYKPSREEVIKMVWEYEGEIEDLEWYMETTSVRIEPAGIISKSDCTSQINVLS